VVGNEECDDHNTDDNDGCSANCHNIEDGYSCSGEPSVCVTGCGDGIQVGAEECDDGNTDAHDGCSPSCTIEHYRLGGTATGVTGPVTLTASNGHGSQTKTLVISGSWHFNDTYRIGDDFEVSITAQPAELSCTLTGTTSGSFLGYDINDLVVTCRGYATVTDDYSTAANVVLGDAGSAVLANGVAQLPAGGRDGDCVIATDIDLTQASCVGRATPDMALGRLAQVAPAGSTALVLAAPLAGLAVDDDLLIVDAQGTPADQGAVGRFEVHRVTAIAANAVVLADELGRSFAGSQYVTVQRLPRYHDVTVQAGATATAAAWGGPDAGGGIFALEATGTVTVNGAVNMSGRGYRGGARPTAGSQNGFQGEGIDNGLGGSNLGPLNGGAGGGGRGECQTYGHAGGGGAHSSDGESGVLLAGDGSESCLGLGGLSIGTAGLIFGAGGGAGGNDNSLTDNPLGGLGGNGGGAIYLWVNGLAGSGALRADGLAGMGDPNTSCTSTNSTTGCWDFAGPGGGGAGGTVWLDTLADPGSLVLSAAGGAGGDGVRSVGGAGSNGVAQVTGTDPPAPYVTSGVLVSRDLLGNRAVYQVISLELDGVTLPSGTRLQIDFSDDGSNWVDRMDVDAAGTVVVDLTDQGFAGPSLYYRLIFTSTGVSTPTVDGVTLLYVQ
jgi:cysteine-rich repeat protein